MSNCYFCNKDLTNINTKPEHIIPNGVGGKLKSYKLLCDHCNNTLSYLDENICKNVIYLTNMLNPKRDNDRKPLKVKITSEGKEFTREANGQYYTKTEFEKVERKDNTLSFTFNATYSVDGENSGRESALAPVFNLIEDFYKDNSDKTEKIAAAKKDILEKIEDSIDTKDAPVLSFGTRYNEDGYLFLAMLKIALGFYAHKNLSTEYIADKIKLLKTKDVKAANAISNYYYPDNFFLDESIYHLIYLKGDVENKLLYCIISLYGCLNTIVILNDNYTGIYLYESYLYDLRNNKEKSFNNETYITQEMLHHILSFSNTNTPTLLDNMVKQGNLFLSFLVRREPNKEKSFIALNDIINVTFEEVCKSRCLSENEYKQKFFDRFRKFIMIDEIFKYSLDDSIDDLSSAALLLYDYKRYVATYIPHVISNVLTNSIGELMLRDFPTLPSKKICKKLIIENLSNIKTDNTTLNDILVEQKNDICLRVNDFIEKEMYPKMIIYHQRFKSSHT